jgi:hypothetical protein
MRRVGEKAKKMELNTRGEKEVMNEFKIFMYIPFL